MLCPDIVKLQDFCYAQKNPQFCFLKSYNFFSTAVAKIVALILEFVLAVFLSCGLFLSAEASPLHTQQLFAVYSQDYEQVAVGLGFILAAGFF